MENLRHNNREWLGAEFSIGHSEEKVSGFTGEVSPVKPGLLVFVLKGTLATIVTTVGWCYPPVIEHSY